MSKLIYLYIKTHNKTGLKYLGKTVQDPFIYKGSGTRWINHLRKHGNDVTTEILFESYNAEEICDAGELYSSLWDIVNSPNFANLRPEEGHGGFSHINTGDEAHRERSTRAGRLAHRQGKLHKFTEVDQIKSQQNRKKFSHTEESKRKISEANRIKQKGDNNSQYGTVWCVTEDAQSCENRKRFRKDEIPSGWISTTEWKLRRKARRGTFGKSWYNDGVKNYLLDPNDPRITKEGLEKKRIR